MTVVPQPASANPPSLFDRLMRQSDMALAAILILIVAMLIVPLPEFFLDTMLVLNITGATLVLLVALYNTEPLQFSIFPSLLLVMTLFRLSLNVAATKLILSNGHAGAVIEAFGKYVISGNYIVGIIAFLIVVVVNFVVITNGAGRVAEVGARFTLDAMPGKQMSIDADMNAGLITEEQAKARRRKIEAEADFYGAMDGSSKFVRGDAMAAVLINHHQHRRRVRNGHVAGRQHHGCAAKVHPADDWRRACRANSRAADFHRNGLDRHAGGLRKIRSARSSSGNCL